MPTSPAHGREGDNGPAAIGRGITALHLSNPNPIPDVPQHEHPTGNSYQLGQLLISLHL